MCRQTRNALRSAGRASLTACAAAIMWLGCSNPFGTSREVTLQIIDIEVPVTIQRSGPLDIVAIVATGGCVTFRRIHVTRVGSATVNMRAVGSDASGPRINCPADIRQERHVLRITGTFADSIVINGKQPHGTDLRRKIAVL